jgi:hypothetical protein
MEASTRVIPLLHHYPVSTELEELWEHGNVMLGFDTEERLIQKLPQDFAADLPPKWTGLGRHTLGESWADVGQGRMQATGIVEALDILEEVSAGPRLWYHKSDGEPARFSGCERNSPLAHCPDNRRCGSSRV